MTKKSISEILKETQGLLSHEVVNPLTVIQGNTKLLLMALEYDELNLVSLKKQINSISNAADKLENSVDKIVTLTEDELSEIRDQNISNGFLKLTKELMGHEHEGKTLFNWSESFELGLRVIDSHHKRIA